MLVAQSCRSTQKGDMGLRRQGNICLEAPFYTYANIGVYHPRLFSGLVRGEKIKLFPVDVSFSRRSSASAANCF